MERKAQETFLSGCRTQLVSDIQKGCGRGNSGVVRKDLDVSVLLDNKDPVRPITGVSNKERTSERKGRKRIGQLNLTMRTLPDHEAE